MMFCHTLFTENVCIRIKVLTEIDISAGFPMKMFTAHIIRLCYIFFIGNFGISIKVHCFAPMISCLYAIEWRCIWTQISFSLHFHPQFELKKCGKIQATVKKPLLNRFKDLIVEGQVYRMAYFTVVSNHGSYRATSHEFKLVFLHRTTVVAVDEDVIPKTCFNMFPFSELLNMTEDYDFLVVGEEKEYAKEGKIVKMIVLLTLRCELFGDYVNQVNHFLASGYVGQPVVVIQLAKVKFFRGQVGLQNVMYATQMLFNPDLPEVVEFRQSMIEQGVNGTQPLFIANEGKVVSLEDDFMRLTRKCTIEELQDNNQLKIIVGEGIFLFFDREASYLLKKSCADLFTEVQRDASLTCGDTYPPIFQGLIGKKLLLKVDIKGVLHDTFYGTF
nr:uncharacterized protein LOC112742433 [Arachis hypogaea]